MKRWQKLLTYTIGDFITSGLVWIGLLWLEGAFNLLPPLGLALNLSAIPIFWLCLFGILGTYQRIYRKSRTNELAKTGWGSATGIIFLIILNYLFGWMPEQVISGLDWVVYGIFQMLTLAFWRIAYLTHVKSQIKRRKVGFPTLMVGSNDKAVELYQELEASRESQGYDFVGFVNIENNSPAKLQPYMANLGYHYNLPEVIRNEGIEEVIIALESSEHNRIQKLIALLADQNVSIKVLPDIYDFITGTVKMNYLFGTALIEVNPLIMPVWQQNLKRVMDVGFSTLILIIGSPLFLAIMAGIKLSSSGPVIFQQERVGVNDEPFFIYKFRTMCQHAEKEGPQLSSENDPRVTPFGRFLRQYRLDELPQFLNVLKGEMSLVGPRPEREYFINQIVPQAPHYRYLLKVKPGITSWGQVKFGYAENVREMIERMKYDLLYIENMSIAMDLKILFYTVYIIFKGRGK